ncbi:hypothetical protein [Streptomyces sp. 5-10]|uniref:hypothetical protein n=1 Tax=Streptomyces sp. 5-10 TaxID=878925 RepID=UPI00168A94A3|nr:hypothetical protein [Streptomyces sp. 5-10]MBD3004603.1 hypothetical protein [Streptomyces sp. 5-10]
MDDYAEMIARWEKRLQGIANTMDTPEWDQAVWDAAVDEMGVESSNQLSVLRTDNWFEEPPVKVTVFRNHH